MPIELPKKPGPDQYEDFVAAALTAQGYFTESNITLRDASSEVLELDVVATPTGPDFSKRRLVEVKTSSWSFGDLFKVYGWMTYLKIKHGCIAYREAADAVRREAFKNIETETDVKCCHVSPSHGSIDDLAKPVTELDEGLRTLVLGANWFSRIALRAALRKFLDRCKSEKEAGPVDDAKQYYWALQQACFAKRPIQRVHLLYEAFQASPNLAGQLVSDLAAKKELSEKKIWDSVGNHGEYLWLQYVMYMEGTARIRIIKNALDHIIAAEKGEGTTIKLLGKSVDWGAYLESVSPKTFKNGLTMLRGHPHRERLPYLFQAFVDVFGGFLIADDEDDLKALAAVAGIPADAVLDCLATFNEFFAISGGWFYRKDELFRMKMVPGFLRGVGAFVRRDLYSLKSYGDKFPTMDWVVRQWHNATYKCLEPVLGETPA